MPSPQTQLPKHDAAARAARIAAAAAALALAVAVAECGPDLRAALPERQPAAQHQRAVPLQ